MKRFLSILLCIMLAFGTITASAFGNEKITVNLTVSIHGEFAKDMEGNKIVLIPVTLEGKEKYCLEDLFAAAHDKYCPGGYLSATGDYGAYITMLWGDNSGNFGYQVNGGSEAVMGLDHKLENGDLVDAVVYKNYYPNTESYTRFDNFTAEVCVYDELELTLKRAGYDENWNTVFSPCEGAVITVDGNETDYTTDSDGKAYISFDTPGTHIVSAKKTKLVNEAEVPDITAPVCVVNAKDRSINAMHNIAEKYSKNGVYSDGNMVWLIADLAMYSELYPETENILTSKEKKKCLDKIISDVENSTSPGLLAKSIIALRAMGYDARDVYNSKSKKADIVAKLTELVDAGSEDVANIYTIPYVIIALSQGEDYATPEQMEFLLNNVKESVESWQSTEWGTDASTAMLLAISPYYGNDEEITAIVNETLPIIISAQDETGLIGNAASTGIALTALSALGTDEETLTQLVNGLMTQATAELDGFEPMENSFSTEQGLRGLVAWQHAVNGTNRIMYDFSDYPLNPARATKKPSSSGGGGGDGYIPPTKTEDTKSDESQTEEPTEVTSPQNGLENKNPDIRITEVIFTDKTFDDIKESQSKKEIEELAKRGIVNGKTDKNFEPSSFMTRAEFATIITRGLGLPLNEVSKFSDIKETDWFYHYVNTAYNYGIIKGVSETRFNPNSIITRQEAAVMIARAADLCGMDTKLTADHTRNVLAMFGDYISVAEWAKEQTAFCYSSKIISDDALEISPEKPVTREEMAQMFYNMLIKAELLQEVEN